MVEPGSMVRVAKSTSFSADGRGPPTSIRTLPQTAPAEAFDSDHDRGLVGVDGRGGTGIHPADEGLVQLDLTGQQVAFGADHRPAQLVQPRPRGLLVACR